MALVQKYPQPQSHLYHKTYRGVVTNRNRMRCIKNRAPADHSDRKNQKYEYVGLYTLTTIQGQQTKKVSMHLYSLGTLSCKSRVLIAP